MKYLLLKRILSWELSDLFRFPILELAVFVTAFQLIPPTSITPPLVKISYINPIDKTFPFITLGEYLGPHLIGTCMKLYLSQAFLTSLFFCLSFSYEAERGFMKLKLSLPISRKSLFLVKIASCFTVLLIMDVLLFFLGLLLQYFPVISLIPTAFESISKFLLILTLQLLYLSSVTILISTHQKNLGTALLFSLSATLVPFTIPSIPRYLEIIPPFSTRYFLYFMVGEVALQNIALRALLQVLISLTMLILSYVRFTRWYEVP